MFRKVTASSTVDFNSDASCKLITLYENALRDNIRASCARHTSRTFAPSSMRCKRKSWFRLRGTEPDFLQEPDLVLDHTAMVGTAVHHHVQETLSNALGDAWIDVEQYLLEHPIPYKYTLTKHDYETAIKIESPPISFACDGIIYLNNRYNLLEIKSSEYESWKTLTDVKPQHIDQINPYATLLNIPHVLTLYVDRMYGKVKSFELYVTDYTMQKVNDDINYVMDMATANIAPERLPVGDYVCSNCEYRLKCKEW